MKKVFISQPMNGLTDDQIRADREAIFKQIEDSKIGDFEVIKSFIVNIGPVVNKPVAYLGKSISCLADADLAVFGKGWENARGCQIEHAVCIAYNIPIIEIGV